MYIHIDIYISPLYIFFLYTVYIRTTTAVGQFMVVFSHMDRYWLTLTTVPRSLTSHPVYTAWWFWVQPQSQRPWRAAMVLISSSLHAGSPDQPLPAP